MESLNDDDIIMEMNLLLKEAREQAKLINKYVNSTRIVIDIETAKTGEIIQIAYNVYDKNYDKIKSFNKLINEGIEKVDFFGKFTLPFIESYGHDPIDVLLEVANDLEMCKLVIGHNIAFDMSRIYKYFEKYGILLNDKPKHICTMHSTKYICCVKNKRGTYKQPKLSELYMHCFGTPIDDEKAHSANYDVEITFQCYYYLLVNGLIEV